MRVWRELTGGLASLFRKERVERDIADEVRHYLGQATDDLVAGGASDDEARRAVRLRYGDEGTLREQVRSVGWEFSVESLVRDLRLAARHLHRNPGFTAGVILTAGLGIGAAVAIFSAVGAVLFEPLGYPDPDRVVSVSDRGADGSDVAVTFGTYRELQVRSRSFEALSVFKPWQPTLMGEQEPERLDGQRVSADYFRVLDVPPALGRGFDATDDRPGGPDVVVLSEGLWLRRFGGDSTLVGRQVRLDDTPFTVVGIMPRGFENVTAPAARVWSLLQYDAAPAGFDTREWGHHLGMAGRLREGVDPDAARSEAARIAATPMPALARPPWASLSLGLSVRPLLESATAAVRPMLLALLGSVALLLAIACVNVTNLVLAHGAGRRGEMAVRTALGAERDRLGRQLVVESLLLSAVGGLLGIGIAWASSVALATFAPPDVPRMALTLDPAVLGLALGMTTIIGLVAGVAPMLDGPGRNLLHGMRAPGRRIVTGRIRARRTLVVAEVAVALVLLAGAGLLLRSVRRLFAEPLGFMPQRVVVMQVQTAGRRFADDGETRRFFALALEAVRETPGVESAALTSQLPLSGDVDVYGVTLEETWAEGVDRSAFRHAVSPGYFETMGIPLLRGRALDERDEAGAPCVVVVNETLAGRAFPRTDPIGRRIHVGRTDLPWCTVEGVVGDVKQSSLDAGAESAVYVAPGQWYFADRAMWVVARTRGDPAERVDALKRAIWSVDGNQPIVRVATMDDLVARSEARRRFTLLVLEAFASMALALAGVGLHGLLAESVCERVREIGVRSALGATRGSIVGLVIREGMALTALGIAIGVAGATVASRFVSSLLFDVSPLDPVTYAGVAILLAAVAALASWVPAARAASVDPARTLRAD